MLPFTPDEASLENYAFYTLKEVGDGYIRFEEVAAPEANTRTFIPCAQVARTSLLPVAKQQLQPMLIMAHRTAGNSLARSQSRQSTAPPATTTHTRQQGTRLTA